MGSTNQVQIVFFQKLDQRLFPKNIRDPSIITLPSIYQRTGISPKQITNNPRIRNFNSPLNLIQLFNRLQIRRYTTMHTKYSIADQCSQWQIWKNSRNHFPKFNTISSFTLFVKTINSIDFRTLMISSQQKEILRKLDLITENQHQCFDLLLPSIYIVS